MHFRLPSFDPGLTAFLWAVGLAAYAWVFMIAVGVSSATAIVVAGLCFCGIFFFVRLRGRSVSGE